MDQWLVSCNLQRHSKVLARTQLVRRHTGCDRLDCSRTWLKTTSEAALAGSVDAHILRPPYTPANWPRVQGLLHTALGITEAAADQALWAHAQVQQCVARFRAAASDVRERELLFPEQRKGNCERVTAWPRRAPPPLPATHVPCFGCTAVVHRQTSDIGGTVGHVNRRHPHCAPRLLCIVGVHAPVLDPQQQSTTHPRVSRSAGTTGVG
jgi:hypothetical protein